MAVTRLSKISLLDWKAKVLQEILPILQKSEIRLMAEILHQFIGSLSHYFQGFIHPRWCRISAINRIILQLFHAKSPEWCWWGGQRNEKRQDLRRLQLLGLRDDMGFAYESWSQKVGRLMFWTSSDQNWVGVASKIECGTVVLLKKQMILDIILYIMICLITIATAKSCSCNERLIVWSAKPCVFVFPSVEVLSSITGWIWTSEGSGRPATFSLQAAD